MSDSPQKTWPPQVKEIYDFLAKEVQWAFARWLLFTQLYDHTEKRVDLLNEVAGTFFHSLQYVMIDELLLSLARLADKSKGTASLLYMQKLLEGNESKEFASKCSVALIAFVSLAAPFKEHRDNLIAHYSIEQAKGLTKLPDIYYKDIKNSLLAVEAYLNLIEVYYEGIPIGYQHVALQEDGEALITVLKWGLKYKKKMLAAETLFEEPDEWDDA
ncbi:AbiU2 domain-containing protein [Rhizobacter fulvus]